MASTDWLVHFHTKCPMRFDAHYQNIPYISDHNEKLKVALELEISSLEKQLEESSRPGGQKMGQKLLKWTLREKLNSLRKGN